LSVREQKDDLARREGKILPARVVQQQEVLPGDGDRLGAGVSHAHQEGEDDLRQAPGTTRPGLGLDADGKAAGVAGEGPGACRALRAEARPGTGADEDREESEKQAKVPGFSLDTPESSE
jgi:hypothetical protein